MTNPWRLDPDRCFDSDPARRAIARDLYTRVKDLPIISPHGHVDPALLSNPDATFGSPADLFIIPDHYVTRMLVSQGVKLEDLGVPTRDGALVETDHRRIWQRFAEHFHLFRGTPTGLWLADELINVFGVTEKLNGESAQRIYDHLVERLAQPECAPRALFKRFNITTLCTTDTASDDLRHHQRLQADCWGMTVRPTFRPDAVVNLQTVGWNEQIERLSAITKVDITDYTSFIRALETQRSFFKEMGATATDHAALTPYTAQLTPTEAGSIFARALWGQTSDEDAVRFTGHMLIEMARMSVEDGLVMQLHVGSFRDHHTSLFERFGPNTGADIPVATEWTRNLRPLLNAYGHDPRFRLILFTLDESTYSRELAPLAGYYPALLLGPPWWFFDSVNGMRRFLDNVIETAGLYNTAGFNDDTRAFASIPTRHDVWRRVSCDWLAGLVTTGLLDIDDAGEMALDCAVGLAKRAYRIDTVTR
jgi:glucuronate isomerase